MSGRRDESLLLDDVVQAVERLIELGGSSSEEIGAGAGTDEQVLYNLIMLGEATKRLRPQTRADHDDVPWRAMARIRDRVVHH